METSQDNAGQLDYLTSLIAELRQIAEREEMPTLAYYLGMAQMEAAELLAREQPRRERESIRCEERDAVS
ncbi:hypothetical protein [Oricola sp.]|uniref:hypothetical protein n=1 Tax=Oricola sp. TaxID=1979950 RepID=UPI003BAC9B4D